MSDLTSLVTSSSVDAVQTLHSGVSLTRRLRLTPWIMCHIQVMHDRLEWNRCICRRCAGRPGPWLAVVNCVQLTVDSWSFLARLKTALAEEHFPALVRLRGTVGLAENARHENAGLENAAQTCKPLQGVENARLENVAQKYRAGKYRNGKCGTKPQRVENAGKAKAGNEKYGNPYVK